MVTLSSSLVGLRAEVMVRLMVGLIRSLSDDMKRSNRSTVPIVRESSTG
jgi:hypothetical protein